MSDMQNSLWLIWSNEHSAWWSPNSMGYTQLVEHAGRYDFAEALEICRGACYGNDWTKNQSASANKWRAPNEVMVPSPESLSATAAKGANENG